MPGTLGQQNPFRASRMHLQAYSSLYGCFSKFETPASGWFPFGFLFKPSKKGTILRTPPHIMGHTAEPEDLHHAARSGSRRSTMQWAPCWMPSWEGMAWLKLSEILRSETRSKGFLVRTDFPFEARGLPPTRETPSQTCIETGCLKGKDQT